MKRISFAVIICLLAPWCAAEFETTAHFDHYTVHYSVFPSTMVSAEVAALHNITRGSDTALINIVVIDEQNKAKVYGQNAEVSGSATNLMQQRRDLEFRAIKEPNTVYYLASYRHINEEIIHFVITIDPEGDAGPYELKFTKTLYIDPSLR